MAPIRVLVVEDSLTVRMRLCEVLARDRDIEVVGQAEDGRRAIELARDLRPDAITMDMMLPAMSGLAATEYIMAHQPTPILIVSSSTNRGELFKTYEALAAGAVDVLEKPGADEDDGGWERRLVAAVKLVARIRVIRHPRARLSAFSAASAAGSADGARPLAPRRAKVVAIGASTGGPGAIVEVLRGLPSAFTAPILLVLHINEPFGRAFGDWLDGQTPRGVRFPEDGERLEHARGRVILAPPGRHLTVRDGLLRLSDAPERHSCRPSVDVLFESVAREVGGAATACLLTGMGRDGAAGMLAIRRAGGLTIAQDEASSVVFGMPREAILLGAAQHVLPIGEIGPALVALTAAEDAA
ncbi:chemotaxis-specific protein-glutamate methyltransferase CheB [Phenylobacterium sp. LjRoot225]|uniref:chemotaxis-specific protein-glutamate methyltransferase CheB n=1 Tax=Phenylobacterium sp. LjRoot225 TaxID=3342285 RepID=UPI003ED01238